MTHPHVSIDLLSELQRWYAGECDGDWEHSYGIKIETLDNPGWWLEVDLNETSLACRARAPLRVEISDTDWLFVDVTDEKFTASGDPFKLPEIIRAFLEFKDAASSEDPEMIQT